MDVKDSLDKTNYTAGDYVNVHFEINNLVALGYTVTISIKLSKSLWNWQNQIEIMDMGERSVSLMSLSTTSFDWSFQLPLDILPGNYMVMVDIKKKDIVLSSPYLPLLVALPMPSLNIIVPNVLSYEAPDEFSIEVANTGNVPVPDSILNVKLTDSNNSAEIWTTSSQLTSIGMGDKQTFNFTASIPAPDTLPQTYNIHADLTYSGLTITKEATLTSDVWIWLDSYYDFGVINQIFTKNVTVKNIGNFILPLTLTTINERTGSAQTQSIILNPGEIKTATVQVPITPDLMGYYKIDINPWLFSRRIHGTSFELIVVPLRPLMQAWTDPMTVAPGESFTIDVGAREQHGDYFLGIISIFDKGCFEDFVGTLYPTLTVELAALGYTSVSQVPYTRAGNEAGFSSSFTVTVPADTPEGIYNGTATLSFPNGQTVSSNFAIEIKRHESKLIILPLTPATYNAGDSVTITIGNIGGVDTQFTSTSKLADSGYTILTATSAGNISAGTQTFIGFTIPQQINSSTILLSVGVLDGRTGQIATYFTPLHINGVSAALSVHTDKPIYIVGEPITGFANMWNGEIPVDATLGLTAWCYRKAGNSKDNWPMYQHDAQHTGSSSLSGNIPTTALWTFTPDGQNGMISQLVAGDIDGNGQSSILFTAYDVNVVPDLYVVNGATGALKWTLHQYHPEISLSDWNQYAPIIIGTLLKGGKPSIVLADNNWNNPGVYLFSSNGGLVWSNTTINFGNGSFTLYDLFGDGNLEIIGIDSSLGLVVLAPGDGTLLWSSSSTAPDVRVSNVSPSIDTVNGNAIIVVPTRNGIVAFNSDGTVRWNYDKSGGGYFVNISASPVISDINGDGKKEVVVITGRGGGVSLFALDLDTGNPIWDSVDTIPGSDLLGHLPPAIVSIAGSNNKQLALLLDQYYSIPAGVLMIDANGGLIWSNTTFTQFANPPISVDMNNDGTSDVLINDYNGIHVLDGKTGNVLWDYPYGSQLGFIVADLTGSGTPSVITSDGIGVIAYGNPATSTTCESLIKQTVWSASIPVTLTAIGGNGQALSITQSITPVNTPGQCMLEGKLTSTTLGQTLTVSSYPFTVVQGKAGLIISTDAQLYKQGSTVYVSGEVVNLIDACLDGLSISITASGGGFSNDTVYTQSIVLDAQQHYAYDFTLPAGVANTVTLEGKLIQNNEILSDVYAQYLVAPPLVDIGVSYPAIVDDNPFNIGFTFTNTGVVSASLNITLTSQTITQTGSLTLDKGMIQSVSFTETISENTTFTGIIIGDAIRTIPIPIIYGLGARIDVFTLPFYAPGNINIPFTVTSTGLLSHNYDVTFTLFDSAGSVITTSTGSYYLGASDSWNNTAQDYLLFVLAPGNYTLAYTTKGFAGQISFSVVLPQAQLRFNNNPVYPSGSVIIPYSITNTGIVPAMFDVGMAMTGASTYVPFTTQTYLEPLGVFTGTVAGSLNPGDYTIAGQGTYISPASSTFKVVNAYSASVSATLLPSSCGQKSAVVTVTSNGYYPFNGHVDINTLFWISSFPVTNVAYGTSVTIPTTIPISIANPGSFTLTTSLYDTANNLYDIHNYSFDILPGMIKIVSLSPYQKFPAGGTASFAFGIQNQGDLPATAQLEVSAFADSEIQVGNITPCMTFTAGYSFTLDPDLEEKDVYAMYKLTSHEPSTEVLMPDQGIVTFGILGVKVSVTATLDKPLYRISDTALLTLTVTNAGSVVNVPLNARVHFYDYDSAQPFVLTVTPTTMQFSVPVAGFDQKLLYQILFTTGRSLYINSMYVQQMHDDIWLYTDKQIYDPGETALVTIGASTSGTANINIPDAGIPVGITKEVALAAQTPTSFTFTIPTIIPAGQKRIDYTLEGVSPLYTYLYDVNGVLAGFILTQLDKQKYQPQDTIRSNIIIQSNLAFTGYMTQNIMYPDGTSGSLFTYPVNLNKGYTFFTTTTALSTTQSGMHSMRYMLYYDAGMTITLASDYAGFDVGDFELIGIRTDKDYFQACTDPANVFADIYGTGTGTLELMLDDNLIDNENILMSGFSTQQTDLPPGLNLVPTDDNYLGHHRIYGTLSSGGLVSTKSKWITVLDTVPPTIAVNGLYDGEVENTTIIPDISITDCTLVGYGITLTQILDRNGNALGLSYPMSSGVPITQEGSYNLGVWAFDKANNTGMASYRFIIDETPPITSIAFGSPYYKSSSGKLFITSYTPIVLSAYDSLSGVSSTYDSIDGILMLYAGAFTITGDGLHNMEYYSVDRAGNVEQTKISQIYVDNTPPVSAITYSPSQTINGVINVYPDTQFSLTATDSGSGVKIIEWSIDDGPPETYSTPFTIGTYAPGVHTIRYVGIDNLDNTEQSHTLVVNLTFMQLGMGINKTPRVLVWAEGDRNVAIAKSALETMGVFYSIVTCNEYDNKHELETKAKSYGISCDENTGSCNEDQFIRQMRTDLYNIYLIMDVKKPLKDHVPDELMEHVNSGQGIVVVRYDKLSDELAKEHGSDLLGTEFIGYLPSDNRVATLYNTPATKQGIIQIAGKVLKLKVIGPLSQIAGTITTQTNCKDKDDEDDEYNNKQFKEYCVDHDKKCGETVSMPAIVLNPYNLGHATVVAFSLGESAQTYNRTHKADKGYEELLQGIITYLTPVVEYMVPSGILPVGIKITNPGMTGNLMVKGSAPAPAYIQTALGLNYTMPVPPIISTSITDNTVSWMLSMNGVTQTSLLYLVRLADLITTYTFTSTVYASDNSLMGSANVVFSMPYDEKVLRASIISELKALKLSRGQSTLATRDKIIKELVELDNCYQKECKREDCDCKHSISDILQAIEMLKELNTDTWQIRLDLDKLLRVWEIKCSAYEK